MSAGETQPTEPFPAGLRASEPAPRRRVWPWLVAAGVVLALAVVAWFAAEAVARDLVTKTIHDQVVSRLSLPASQQVDVEVPGAVIPQLIRGALNEVTVSSDDVSTGDFSGDVTVTARDVKIPAGDIGSATAVVVLDQEQLRALMAQVEGFPVETLGLAEPNVTISTDLALFGVSLPVGVALTPSAVGGDLVLTPAALELGGGEVTADALRSQFGAVADLALRDWTLCLAQYLPVGVTLTGVQVQGATLVADLDVDGRIVTDPALQANGTCA